MLSRRTLLLGAAGAAAVLPTILHAAPRRPVVETTRFRVRGTRETGLAVFRGIPYGVAERFMAPQPMPVSRAMVEAVRYGPSAPQRGDRYAPQDERCQYLNIWTPEVRAGGKRPVMVYIHGGAYSGGSVVDPLNDGRHLAAHGDVVVVTVNHRLNAFGYLYLARLDPRFADSGNAGQIDLILALQWIRDNIARFGGDPDRVMVFGQSGGGAKIATMMGMPAARGLFHRAATMSGQQVTASGPLNATARTKAYLAALKVSTPGELLTLPAEKLIEALTATDPIIGGGVYFGPVLDMKWLTRHPFWPDANPQSNAIPMILGNTRDETRGFVDARGPKLQGLDWTNLAERMIPELRMDIHPEWVVAQYRARFPDWSPERVFYAATTAGRSWPGQVLEADARAAAKTPTWVYQLDFQSPVEPWRGAPHTLDIPLVFGTLDAEGSIAGTGAASRKVSREMMDAFVAFARTGDPARPGLPWPVHTLPSRETMVFDTQSRAVNDPRQWERELFARVPYIQPGT